MSWLEAAEKKLKAEKKTGEYDRYASAMKSSVYDKLLDFCRQNDEFAQSVAQGGTFEDCMKAVAKDCKTCLSDLDAYIRAVRFYFPGAAVRCQMVLDLTGDAAPQEEKAVVLNFADFW